MANEKTKKELVSWMLVILGSFLFAVGDIMFANPYHLAPGGTWGLSNVLHAIAPWKISFYVICMDIPLLIFGTWILGPKFGIKTVAATIFNILFAFLIEMTWGYYPIIHQGIFETMPAGLENLVVVNEYSTSLEAFGFTISEGVDKVFYFIPDYMLNTIVTGLVYGIAIGLIFRAGATSGGSDIVSMVLHKYTKISLGTLVIIVDGIITFSTLFIGMFKEGGYGSIHEFTASLRLPINSFIVVFIEGILIDLVVDGFKKPKTLIIRTSKAAEVAAFVKENLQKKSELIVNGDMVVVTLKHADATKLNIELSKLDPECFITVMESKETYGLGYKSLPVE